MATRRSTRKRKGVKTAESEESQLTGIEPSKEDEPSTDPPTVPPVNPPTVSPADPPAVPPVVPSPALPKVQWEWAADDGWKPFGSAESTSLTKGLIAGKSAVSLQVAPSVTLKVDLSRMTQTNTATGWQRDVRCVPASSGDHTPSTSPQGQWEWEDEHGKWNRYSPAVQRLLWACERCGAKKCEFEAVGRRYTFEAGKQTNVETGVQRSVRCNSFSSNGAGDVSASATSTTTNQENKSKGGGARAKGGGAKSTSRKRKKKSDVEEEKEQEEDEGEKDGGGRDKKAESSQEDTDNRVLVTYRGKVPVDHECHQKVGKAHVYSDGSEHWDATLNQTNLKNNNNKFYILQLLKDNQSTKFSVWFRWGRVGKAGQHSLTECGGNLEQAKDIFMKKFRDKTCNSWEDRGSFVKHAGKYDLLSMDYETKDETDGGAEEVDGGEKEKDSDSTPSPTPESKLDSRVQSLIELICDVQAMEDTVLEMKYDAKKAPLGKLTADQVRSGYAALKLIEDCINRNDFGDKLVQACDQFYTRIPHSFGMQRPPLIRTKQEVKEKLGLLETLSDIQIALKVLSGGDQKEHPIDRHYLGLNCTLTPVDPEDEKFQMIVKYVRQTHAKTHSQYRLEVKEVFQVAREGEKDSFKDVGNRYLLWHGSRLSNWVGILSQGLRIAPPEAPVTGYMFGKGIYFADMCSKSTNYCFATRTKSDGLALLCDVSLGQTQDCLAANYNADRLPKGKYSTKGLGKLAPNPAQNQTLGDGCIVPLGMPIDTGVHNPSGYTLNYNEYIVYDTKQSEAILMFLVPNESSCNELSFGTKNVEITISNRVQYSVK